MEFSEFMKLIYVKGYFKTQPEFIVHFLKGSVQQPAKVSFTESAIKSYLSSNRIRTLAQIMMDAGLQKERIVAYIEGLYQTKHTMSPTYQERFHGQTYKEVLYEKVQQIHPDITVEEMSDFLASQFYEIIETAAGISKNPTKPQTKPNCSASTFSRLSKTVLDMIILSERLDRDSKCIAEWLKKQPQSKQYSACPQWKTFHDAFQELQDKNAELKAICEVVKWNDLSAAASMGEALHAHSLALCYHEKNPNHQLIRREFECYRKKLVAINAEIEQWLK